MTNGAGTSANSIEDFAYYEQAPGIRAAREALRNFPINISTRTVWDTYLRRGGYEYGERADDIAVHVLREAQKQCWKAYPDGEHPFLMLERLPEDYLRDRGKPPSSQTLRQAARFGRIMRAIERRAQRSHRPVAQHAGSYAGNVPRVQG